MRILLEAALANNTPDAAQAALIWLQQSKLEDQAIDKLMRRIGRKAGV